MTEEAKLFIEELRTEGCRRCIHMKIGQCAHIQQGKTCGTLYHQAADLIESLSAQLEQVKDERDGLNIMLTQAQAMLETRTKERDAAVEMLRDSAFCCDCTYYAISIEAEPCKTCVACPNSSKPNWQWRGVREVE